MSGTTTGRNPPIAAQPCLRRRFLASAALAAILGGVGAPRVAASQQPLRLGGTGMALASMRKIGKAFAASESGTSLDVLPSLGTGGGLTALAAGAIDLAVAARNLNDAELAKGLLGLAYARTPIAFVTQQATTTENITLADLASIFSGTMNAWPDGVPIRLIRREPSDADWTMLRGISPDMAGAVEIAIKRPGLLTVSTDQENGDALERIRGSFGAMSIGQLRAEGRELKPLALNGVKPELEELSAGRYTLSRTLYVAWKQPPRPEVKQFLEYLGTEPAKAILVQLGHIALSGTGR